MFNKSVITTTISSIVVIGLLIATVVTDTGIEKIRNPKNGLLNVGHAVFGFTADKWQGDTCDAFISSMKGIPEWHISILYNSFGNNWECLKRFLNRPEARTVQFHLINEVCHRSGNCQYFEFAKEYGVSEYDDLWAKNDPELLKKFFAYVKPLQQLLEHQLPSRPHVRCIIGPGLESNVGEDAAKNQIKAAKKAFPYCDVSWNGMRSTGWSADIQEDHAANNPGARPPCLINLDGEDIDFPERRSATLSDGSEWTNAVSVPRLKQYIEKYANYCQLYYLWTWEGNCSIGGYKKDPNQRKRPCDHPQIQKVIRLTADIIRWAAKEGNVKPTYYNWSYDESLPLKLCTEVAKKSKKIKRQGNKGKLEFPINDQIVSISVMYKTKLIDVYTFSKAEGDKQIWISTVNPRKRYPYKSVLMVTTTSMITELPVGSITPPTELKCWKINSVK